MVFTGGVHDRNADAVMQDRREDSTATPPEHRNAASNPVKGLRVAS
jgi:hypothetical protein